MSLGHLDTWVVYSVGIHTMTPRDVSWNHTLIHPDRDPLLYFQDAIRCSNGRWSIDSILVLIQKHGTRYIMYNRGCITEGIIDTLYEDVRAAVDENTYIDDILAMY
jgi:hypothetical protein